MRCLVPLPLGLLCAVAAFAAISTGAAEESWRAGAARVCITPDEPVWMAGYASRNRPAEGKLHDLWAKALVLEDAAGRRCVLVTLDVLGVPRDFSQQVSAELAERFGFKRSEIVLSTTHTHSGPVIGFNLRPAYPLEREQQEKVTAYTEALAAKIVAGVEEAVRRLGPAELQWGEGNASFAVNRRTNPEGEVEQRRGEGKLAGPFDHSLPVLAVRDPAGELRAVVCGYACHATVLSGYQWSGDWPGFAALELERRHPEAIAMIWAGCGADQNPLPRRKLEYAEAYGRQLAEGVEQVLRREMQPIHGPLAAAYNEIELGFQRLPSRAELEEAAESTNRYEAARAGLLLAQWDRHGALRETYPYPVQTWRLGDGPLWVMLGGEVVVDFSLRLKLELKPARVWVTAYANDVMAYIPSRRVLLEGGYEGGGAMVYYGLPSPWRPDVEEKIIREVHRQREQLRPGEPPK